MTALLTEYGSYLNRVRTADSEGQPPLRRLRKDMGERARSLWTLAHEAAREAEESAKLGQTALDAAYNPVLQKLG